MKVFLKQMKAKIGEFANSVLGKRILLAILAAAAMCVIFGVSREHLPFMTRSITLSKKNTVDFVREDGFAAAIWKKKILFADGSGKLKSIVNAGSDGVEADPRVLASDRDSVYAVVAEVDTQYNYFSGERVLKYSGSGEFLGELWRKDYDRDDRVSSISLTGLTVGEDALYITETNDRRVRLLRVSRDVLTENPPDVIADLTMPESIQRGEYTIGQDEGNGTGPDPGRGELLLFSRFGEMYRYDTGSGKMTLETEIADPAGSGGQRSGVMQTGLLFLITDTVYYLSIAILCLAAVLLVIRIILSGVLAEYRLALIFAFFVVCAVVYYTNHALQIFEQQYGKRITSSANAIVASLDYLAWDDIKQEEGKDFQELFRTKSFRDKTDRAMEFLQAQCLAESPEMGLYAQMYYTDRENRSYLIADTLNEHPVGTPYEQVAGLQAGTTVTDTGKELFTVEVEADGIYGFHHVPIFNDDGKAVGFVEVGSEYSRLYQRQITRSVESALQLLAFIVFMYVFLDMIHKSRGDIREYRELRSTDPEGSRVFLANVYVFVVSAMMYIDSYLMVMTVSYICGDDPGVNMALMLALPLTAFRVGSFIGSAITSTVVGWFGDRKAAVLSAVLSILSFAGMAGACVVKSIALFCVCKVIEGIFLESVLYAIAEGIPYGIEDKAMQEQKIRENQSATAAAILIILMLAGFIAEYVNFTFLYVFGALGCMALIPLSLLALGKTVGTKNEAELSGAGEAGTAEKAEPHGSAWAAFLKPKSLIYFVMVVFAVSMLGGYEEYLFPLFSERSGLSSIMLSSFGVLANAAAYFGAGVLVFFKKYSPLRSLSIAFGICGAGLLLFILNDTVFWAVAVLLLINTLTRVIDNYKIVNLIRLNEQDGYDSQEIQENYYAVEDGFKILHGPVLGGLFSIGSKVVCAALGLLCLLGPGLYERMHKPRV